MPERYTILELQFYFLLKTIQINLLTKTMDTVLQLWLLEVQQSQFQSQFPRVRFYILSNLLKNTKIFIYLSINKLFFLIKHWRTGACINMIQKHRKDYDRNKNNRFSHLGCFNDNLCQFVHLKCQLFTERIMILQENFYTVVRPNFPTVFREIWPDDRVHSSSKVFGRTKFSSLYSVYEINWNLYSV